MLDEWNEYLVIKLAHGRKCCISFSGPAPDQKSIQKVCDVLQLIQYLEFDPKIPATKLLEPPNA